MPATSIASIRGKFRSLEATVLTRLEELESELKAATTVAETAASAIAREKALAEKERLHSVELRARLTDALRKNSILMQREEHLRKFLLGP